MYTDFRPTPLQHYVFPMGGDGLYLVVDEKTTFREDNFQKAVNAVSSSGAVKKENGKLQKLAGRKKEEVGPSDIFKLVKMIMVRQYDPVIVFCFSKRDCEAQALQVLCLPNLLAMDEMAVPLKRSRQKFNSCCIEKFLNFSLRLFLSEYSTVTF